jgi:hypothetical protein
MKLQTKLNISFFLVCVFGIGALNLFGSKSATVSTLEQRQIQARPVFTADHFFEGQYTRDFDNYFSDNFAFRTSLVQAGSQLKGLKGIEGDDGASIFVQGGDNMAVDLNHKDGESSTSNSGSIKYLILKDRALTLFVYSAAAADQYADALNRFKASVGPDVRVLSLLAPTSSEFVDNEKYKEMSSSQKLAFEHIDEKLDPSIVKVDAYGALESHSEEYVFFRTDHHWTALGAYYAYTSFMNAIGEKPVPLNKYKSEDIPNFLGTAYKGTLSDKLKEHPDTITYYPPFVTYKYAMHTTTNKKMERKVVDPAFAKSSSTFYAVFLGGDYPWGEISTANKNGKRIAVVKDSYANAFIPFLLPHYEKIYYIDPRYFQENMTGFVKKNGISDVLFLNNSTVARNDGIAKLLNEKMDIVKP